MKKLLLVVGMVMFAVSAYAADLSLSGFYEMRGFSIQNANAAEDAGNGVNWNGLHYTAQLAGQIDIDAKTTAFFRYDFADNVWGQDLEDSTGRVWIEYKLSDAITLKAGRPTGADYARTFGNGFWNKTGEGTGGTNLIRADFAVNSATTIYTVWEKRSENTNASDEKLYGADSEGDPDSIKAGDLDKSGDDGDEADLYVLGANIKSGNLGIYPVLTYYRDSINGNYIANQDDFEAGANPVFVEKHLPNESYLGLYLATEYLPKTGLNAKFAVAYLMDNTEENTDAETGIKDHYAFDDIGAYLDLSYVADSFTVGAILAYGSANSEEIGTTGDEKYSSFAFGAEFDKTVIMDQGLRDGGGVAGATAAMLYADINATDKLTLSLIGAYYMPTDDKIGMSWNYLANGNIAGDIAAPEMTAYEIDFSAKYAFSDSTELSFGAAYAQLSDSVLALDADGNDINDADGKNVYKDSDPIIQLWWAVATTF